MKQVSNREEALDVLLESVALMRAWQKKYFKTRSSEALRRSFFFEALVDSYVETFESQFYEDEERLACRAKNQGLWPSE